MSRVAKDRELTSDSAVALIIIGFGMLLLALAVSMMPPGC